MNDHRLMPWNHCESEWICSDVLFSWRAESPSNVMDQSQSRQVDCCLNYPKCNTSVTLLCFLLEPYSRWILSEESCIISYFLIESICISYLLLGERCVEWHQGATLSSGSSRKTDLVLQWGALQKPKSAIGGPVMFLPEHLNQKHLASSLVQCLLSAC